jgi:hypothetical protein
VEYDIMELTGTKYRLIVFALAPLAISATAPAEAAGRTIHSPRPLYLYAPTESEPGLLSKEEQTSPPRAAAIHECNVWARQVGAERDWQAATYTRYGVCMVEHGQRFS